MNPTLGKRHLDLAHQAKFTHDMRTETLMESTDRLWKNYDAATAEAIDATDGISGDDLARIAAFESKREPSLWADVTTHGLEAAA